MPRVAIRKAGHRQCGGMHGSKIKYSRATIAIQEGVDHMVAGRMLSQIDMSPTSRTFGTCQRATARLCLSQVRRSADSTVPRGAVRVPGAVYRSGTGVPVSLSRFADGLSFRPKSSSVSIVGFAGAVRERTPPPLGRGGQSSDTPRAVLGDGRERRLLYETMHKRNRKSPAAVRVTTSAVPWSQGVRQVLRLRAVCCSA